MFVGDAKYKLTPLMSGVKKPDLYQLLAYAQAAGLSSGMLIYAAGETEETRYEIARADKVLEVRTLDLDQDPEGLLTQIRRLAVRIGAMRGQEIGRVPRARPRPRTPAPHL